MNHNYDALAVGFDNTEEILSDKTLQVQTYDDTVWTFGVNGKSKICSYASLRKALMSGINREAVSIPNWAQKATGIVPNICSAGGENYRQAVKTASYRKYSNERASALYREFSERYKADTGSEEIPVFRFLCTAAFEQGAKQMVQNWQMYFGTGFEVKISVLSAEELSESVNNGEFDGVIMPVSADTTDAMVFLKQFCADNVFHYRSDEYEEIINSSQSETEKCKKCENLLLEDAFVYPIAFSQSYYVQRQGISGIYFYPFGGKVNFLNAQRSA